MVRIKLGTCRECRVGYSVGQLYYGHNETHILVRIVTAQVYHKMNLFHSWILPLEYLECFAKF